jgi:site-specific DNA recombinase
MADCPFPPGAKVAAYLRDSGGDDQDQSIPQQEIEIRKYCAEHSLTLTTLFKDEARSGSSTVGREHFWRMIHHFHHEAEEAGVLIWRTNRFGRNINDSQYYKADLRRRGYIVHSLKDNIPEGSAGSLVEFALDWKDQIFIEQLSEDVKRGLRQLVQEYGCVPGTPPRGFKRERVIIGKRRDGSDHIGHRWVPDPEKIPLVIRAFEMRSKGATIPQIMTATGLFRSGNSFTTFFSNRLYIGVLDFGDISLADYCEPIIARPVWDEVQRVGHSRSLPQHDKDHPRRISSPFLLSGVIHCQECGSPMSGYTIKRWSYYACSRRQRKHDCHSRRVPSGPIEAEVVRLLTERMLALENLLTVQSEIQNAWSSHKDEHEGARRGIEKDLTSVERKITNITQAIAEAGHSRFLLDQLIQLEREETDLRADLEKYNDAAPPKIYTRPQMSEIAEAVKAELNSDDLNKKRAALRGLVHRVIAKRTDDQIIGVMYCNQVNATVPPRGAGANNLLYPIEIKVKKHKAPAPR